MDRTGAATLTLLFALSAAAPAHAFTTRVHIVVSNEIRAELVRSGDGTIQLRWSGHAVRIPEEDAEAIINQPLAFRAGAIGPDNVVFPAMTDGTHGVEQDPYGQCELLYREALTETERAYALGCFLHGATDAIAHHVVNYFTGETFTLNPISHGRTSDFDNVIGHIVSESAIQSALHASDPTLFSAGQLQHALPHDFLLRTYFNVESPVWQRMSLHARERWDAARATNPNGNVLTWAQNAGFAPWEQLAMAPVYVAELQRLRAELRLWIENEIADMADPSSARGRTLGVTPGPDGTYGTPDDATACTATCPSLAAQYYVYVNVLAPRYDAAGRELPSAFDVLSNAIGDQLYGFLPALVHVIENLSALLNAPIAPGDTDDHGLDVSAADLAAAFGPLSDWLDALVRTTDSGFDDLADAITPEWYRDLAAFLQSLGIDIRIGNVLRTIFGPIVENVRDTLEHEVRGRAEQFITDLTREYEERLDDWRASIEADLAISAPPGLGGHALDYPADAGVFAYAFNLAAVALAQHDAARRGGSDRERARLVRRVLHDRVDAGRTVRLPARSGLSARPRRRTALVGAARRNVLRLRARGRRTDRVPRGIARGVRDAEPGELHAHDAGRAPRIAHGIALARVSAGVRSRRSLVPPPHRAGPARTAAAPAGRGGGHDRRGRARSRRRRERRRRHGAGAGGLRMRGPGALELEPVRARVDRALRVDARALAPPGLPSQRSAPRARSLRDRAPRGARDRMRRRTGRARRRIERARCGPRRRRDHDGRVHDGPRRGPRRCRHGRR